MKLTEADISAILDDCKAALEKVRLDDFEKEQLFTSYSKMLTKYRDHFGENTEIRYRIRKRLVRLELVLSVKGEKWNPFLEERDAEALEIQNKVHSLSFGRTQTTSCYYMGGYNVVVLKSSVFQARSSILKQPVVWAVALGIVAGLICQALPQPTSIFIVDRIASPVLDLILKQMSGIMGPIIFLSLVTAINTLESINELNKMGFKIVGRFIFVTVFCALVAGVVGVLIFGGLAKGTADFEPSMIIDLLLDIVPVSLVTPFVTNNIPQIVVLGIGLGAMLLLLGERTARLADILQQTNEWINELLNLVLKVVVIVPFLSIFKIVAKGESSQFLEGWSWSERHIFSEYQVC